MKRSLFTIVVLAAAVQLALAAGAHHAAAAWLEEAIVSGRLVTLSLSREHHIEPPAEPAPTPPPAYAAPTVLERPLATPSPTPEPAKESSPDYGSIEIDNTTSLAIAPQELMAEPLQLSLPKEGPQILIMHTHGTESYAMEPGWEYEESDLSRTTDPDYNMLRVGQELAAAFERHGLNVMHDTTLHDYPSYTGSYSRSGQTVESILAQHPDIAIVIDLHRDAIGSGDTIYKTQAEIPGTSSAQVMLLAGTGENGLEHPNRLENIKLALLLQAAAESTCPTLMRPLAIRPERYNQQLSSGALIIEVGSNGNTLQEAITAVQLFADAVSPTLLEYIEG